MHPSQHATAATTPAAGFAKRRRWRRSLAIIPAVIAAAALAGCFSIVGQSTVQEGDIGDVIVRTDMCLSNGAAGCNAGLSDTAASDVQYLIGYLVPTWAVEPLTIEWNGDAGDQVFARNVAYESILQGFAPAPLGLHWVGYTSGRRPAPPVGVDQRMQAVARIGVPPATNATSLQLATVTGWRLIRDQTATQSELSMDRAFNCAETTDGAPTTACILSGKPDQATTPGQTPLADDIPLNTLNLSPPPDAKVRAGSQVVLRFPIATNFSGAGNDTIPMRVTTTLRGAQIESPPNVILGGSLLPAEVRVTAPLIAETGDYTVTLATANGLRSATANLHVTGIRTLIGPTTNQTVTTLKQSAALLRKYLRTAKTADIRRGNTFDLPVALPSVGKIKGVLTPKRGRSVLSQGTSTLKIPGTATLHLAPTSKALKTLHAGKPLKGKLTLTFTPRSGKTQTAYLTVSLK